MGRSDFAPYRAIPRLDVGGVCRIHFWHGLAVLEGGEEVRLNLQNGWTLSVVRDLHKPYFSVAAWPTADDEAAVSAHERRWHECESGGIECRIVEIDELIEFAACIAAKAKPT